MVKLAPPVAVAGMIFFGTMCSLLAKLIYSVHAMDSHGNVRTFEKPWFQVLAMFLGMSVCIVLDLPGARRKRRAAADEEAALLGHPPEGPPASIWIISIPTLFDLFATACGTTGLLYTTVSVYQMLRGAMLVWTALLSIIFLRCKLTRMNYAGIALCVAGIALVGLANVWGEDNPRSRSDTIFGIIVILLGQVLQAGQVVIEEFLLRDLRMSSVRVVAWEGLFGIAHCLLWVFPLIYFLPGRDHGHMEDTWDAVYMLTHSFSVAAIIFTDMTMMLFYNVCGMEVTESLSAVHRVVIETLRTLFVWLADLFIYYALSGGRLGESWTAYSYLQLAGFGLLVLGTVAYNFDNLKADFEMRQNAATAAAADTHVPSVLVEDASAITKYDSTAKASVLVEDASAITKYDSTAKVQYLATTATRPVAVSAEDDVEEEEEVAGSYYGSLIGSVAHSPFLVASAGTPGSHSLSHSLRQRMFAKDSH